MAALQPGRLLARRYRLIDQIGAGGMSVIWRARDEVLDRVVAVKVLAPSLAADARFRDMVREEARSAAQLVHPHVTAVHDYGETLAPDGEITSFVVMELLSGEELENRLSEGPLPWPEAVEVGAQVAEALAAAHRLGIVHRDITPANVMMTRTGAKVLDFGIATQVGAPDEDEDGGTFGTPAYVAPERLDGAPAQPATDVYSLGVLLYETLTGRVPFPADTWEDLGEALQSDETPSLDGVPGLPPAVARTCLRCLARDPRDRPTAHQVAAALRDQMLPGDPQAATMLSPTVTLPALPVAHGTGDDPGADGASAAAPHGDHSKTTPGHRRRAARPGSRRPLVLVGGLALVVTTAALIAPTLTPRSPAPPSNALPTTAPVTDPPATPDDQITVPPAAPTATATSTSPPSRPQPAPDGGQGAGGLTEAAERLRTLIDDGVRSGDIRSDVGIDLRNVLANLTREAADGRADLAEPVARLREKVTRRVQEGAITPEFARHLDTAILGLGSSQV
ncbi:serine/threonine-protein kinase [Micromonospora coxensis]|uniref:non-specific serine/threonine protein kinase n=1 Tax=Micromonospora coxensis TaxID=356852 RepID=A0A1C5I4Z2_9ACTN|nr:serine/threonine-protein kinase [Micromonospora coxensis]SCG53257.1 Serine/threonine protein kinase [Micromonospora coxensis]